MISILRSSRHFRNYISSYSHYGQQRYLRYLCLGENVEFNYINYERNSYCFLSFCGQSLWFKRENTGFYAWGETELYLKRKDRVSDNYQLIYRAPMPNYIIWTMNIMNPINIIFAGACVYYCFQDVHITTMKISDKLVSYDNEIYFYLLYYVALNMVLRLVVSMYPLRIYREEDKLVNN